MLTNKFAGTCLSAGPAIAEYTLLSGHPASPYQAAIFDHFRNGRGSVIVEAVAGSGKTTTIKNALRYLPERLSVQMFAFNTEAAKQLRDAVAELIAFNEKSYRGVRAGTFHSVGFGAIARHLNLTSQQLMERSDRDGKCRKLLRLVLGEDEYKMYGSFVLKLVGHAKQNGLGALVPDLEERWWEIVEHHGMYLDAEDADPGEAIAIARDLLRRSNEAAKTGVIDGDDMVYLPLLWKLRLWQNDVVIMDEAQDAAPGFIAFARLALRPGGRLYAVGDRKQSINAFAGALPDAMDVIKREFRARELALSVCYRCASSIVERAQTWVPHIRPTPGAAEGVVEDDIPLHAAISSLTGDDAILCRNTAPLVEIAYGLIARGRPCRILGREIGEGLVSLIEQMKARGVDRLVEKLEAFRERESARFTAKGEEQRAEAVADRVNCVLTIAARLPETARTVPVLIERIRAMFSDRQEAGLLTLATAHKSKGREWPQVAILRPELMPSRAARQEWAEAQEYNLMYVAATRAKQRLVYCAAEDMQIDKEVSR
jgi:superfamily I DNA/RNA helicase